MYKTVLTQLLTIFLLAWPAFSQEQKIRIGVSIPLSGDASVYGQDIKRILTFANSQVFSNRYQFIFEDDKCTGKDAATVAHKFVSIDKVKYVLGFACSSALLAAAPIYEQAHVLAIGILTTSPDISKAGQYIFRTVPGDELAAKMLSDYIAQSHKQLAIISEETEYCESLLTQIQQNKSLNPIVERYKSGESDFRSLILRLKSKNPDALMLNPQSDGPLITMVKEIKSLHWDIPLYGAYYPSSANFVKAVGAQADGITFVDPPTLKDLLSPDKVNLYQRFLDDGGPLRGIDYVFVLTYNALAALDGSLMSTKDPKEAMYNLKFDGLSGQFSFDKNGDFLGFSHLIKRIVNGAPIAISNIKQKG
jgi:branched-chain amino acid transport system substrate-binding protein